MSGATSGATNGAVGGAVSGGLSGGLPLGAERFFAATYAEARSKFLSAAAAAGLAVQSHAHPLPGLQGEALAMDVARSGPADAPALLVISSACHGAEGFCGSGVQGALLADASFARQAHAGNVAVLYIHALNPYGFSWLRRTTHENVDLNRNWQDFEPAGGAPARLPANPGYEAIAHHVVPATWPPPPEGEAALAAYAARHGERALQAALSQGQYSHPEGLFFGGHRPTWSRQTLSQVFQAHGRRCQRLGWIDIHTGLGPSGHGERIFADRNVPEALARARAWWGPEVTSVYDGSSTSAELTGLLFNAIYLHCPQAEYTGMALEYGTQTMPEVMAALRADQWLYNHPEASAEQRVAIQRQMRNAFYVDTPAWKERIVAQGIEAAMQALQGLQRQR